MIDNKNHKLYPIRWRGQLWQEEDCANMFNAYYAGRGSLAPDGSVYTGDGDWMYPDGTWSEIM